jgi:hypothetical protein
LVWEIRPANSEELGALRQIEAVRMPLIDRPRERGRAQPAASERGLDRIIANLATLVVVAEHTRAEGSRQHLCAKAEPKQRFVLGERSFEPLDLSSYPVERVIDTHRAAEHDNAVMVGEPIRQRLAATRPPNVKPNVCAVTRRRFPVGASPTRQPLQPEATGAVMEVTKWLKPSV